MNRRGLFAALLTPLLLPVVRALPGNSRERNARILSLRSALDPQPAKSAVDAINAFTRTKMREEGFLRRIMPPSSLINSDLDRRVGTDKPITLFDNMYIRGPRRLPPTPPTDY